MKFAALALLATGLAFGQTNFAFIGVSTDGVTSAGTGMYAKQMTDIGTYAFTVVDAVPTSLKPFSVVTSFSACVAQRVVTLGKVSIFAPTAAGVSYSGANTGWSWTTGAIAVIPVKSVYIAPNVRVVKSSVSNGTGYQLIGGIMLGWGW